MDKTFELKKILKAFKKFDDYSDDLLNSDYATFETRLNIFIDFCENDKVMSFITNQLKGYDFTLWFDEFRKSGGSMAGSADFKLPLDENDRLSLLYQILLKINSNEIKFTDFCMMAFKSADGTITGLIYKLNEAITRLLVRDLNYKMEEIKDEIEITNQTQEINQEHLVIINTGNISNSQLAIGMNIKQMKISKNSDLDDLINNLTDLILADDSIEDFDKEDLLYDVESMKTELQKNKINKERIMGYLTNFVTFANLAQISQEIIGHISSLKM